MNEIIKEEEITFLIRGLYSGYHPSYRDSETFKLIRSIEQYFPYSQIIFSTWKEYKFIENIKIQHPSVSLVLNKSVERKGIQLAVGNLKDIKKYRNSINSQILSTCVGLNYIKTKYVCIVRSDFIFHNNNLKKLYPRYATHNYNKKFSIFEKPILIPFYGSVNSYKHILSRTPNFPFHPSDMFHFGLYSDLKEYFDCPLMSVYDFQYFLNNPRGKSKCLRIYDSGYLCKFLPEQYLFTNYLRKKDILTQTDFVNMEDRPEKYKKLSHLLILNNFFMVNFRELGASWHSRKNVRLLKLPFFIFKNRTIVLSSIRFHLSRYSFLSRRVPLPYKLYLSISNLIFTVFESLIAMIYNLNSLTAFRQKLDRRLKGRIKN